MTCNFTYENNISYVNFFNSMREMKISYVKLIFTCECSISDVKYLFRTPRFHVWNFEPVHFTCELSISYANRSQFQLLKEKFWLEFRIAYDWTKLSLIVIKDFKQLHRKIHNRRSGDSYRVKSLKVDNCRDWSQRIQTFRAKAFVRERNVFWTSKLWISLRSVKGVTKL